MLEPRPKVLISSSEIKEKDQKGPYSDLLISEESYNYKTGKLVTAFPTIPCMVLTDLVGWLVGLVYRVSLTYGIFANADPTHTFFFNHQNAHNVGVPCNLNILKISHRVRLMQ